MADDRYERFLAMGRAALEAGRPEEAARLLGEAVALRPEEATVHVELAGVLRGLGRVDLAQQVYARALEADPRNAAAAAGLHSLRPDAQQRPNFEVGQVLVSQRHVGTWTILKVLRGGFGVVYVVQSSPSSRRRVLKTFDTRLLWSDADRERFEREALTWVRLDQHRHITNAEGIEWIEGLPCVVTEYAEGGDLARKLRSGPLSPEQALRYARHLCDGLRQANEQLGLVHRDVKPANCLLTKDGVLQVSDFGLARAFEGDSVVDLAGLPAGAQHLYTTAAGTPSYMAPEQFASGVALDARADIYAFGVVFFQMLAGTLPPGNGKAREYIDRHTRRRDRKSRLVQLIRACTEPDRKNRPQDFAAVRELLDGVYREVTGSPAPPPPSPDRVSAEDWVSKSLALAKLSRCDEALDAVRRGLEVADRNGDSDVTRSKLWQVRGMALATLRRYDEALAAHDRAVGLDPAEPSAWNSRGNTLHRMRRLEEAVECYDRTLKLQPADETAWRDMALALVDLGRHEDADEAYARGLSVSPRDEHLLTGRAVLRRSQGRKTEALSDLDRALAVAPRNFEALQLKGSVLRDLSRPAEATEVLLRATEIRPDDRDVWWGLMSAALDLERYDRAWEYYERVRALGGETAALVVFEGLIIGREHGFGGRALACFERALELDPTQASAWVNKADALIRLDRADEALAAYDQAVAHDPQSLAGWTKKAYALRDLNRREEALAWLDRGVEAIPTSANLWGQRGRVLVEFGRLDQALPCYQRWRDLDPTEPGAWQAVGYVLGELGRADEQLTCYTEAIELWPDRNDLWRYRAYVLRRQERFEEAEAAYATAVELDPDESETFVGRGVLWQRQERFADALADFDRAIALSPDSPEGWLRRSACLLSLGRDEEALACCEDAIAKWPDDDDFWHNKGVALESLGRDGEAAAAFETARSLE